MKALTVWQPWASLLALGMKRYETRGWLTSYRGPLAIHAGAKRDGVVHAVCGIEPFCSILAEHGFAGPAELPYGAVIAVGELVACHPVETLKLSKLERAVGDFSEGRFAWEFANVRMLDTPIPARGWHQLWDWEEPS
ncbi:MAG: ASCH domain-containing protein [Planctomycetaceae bacterium]